jgi:DNA-binding GntR family transcriptional regulator
MVRKSQVVREHIMSQIESGRWPKGHKLPAKSSLAMTLNCHPETVATVIKALIAEGILYRASPWWNCVR